MKNNTDDLANQLIQKIKSWLKEEIQHNQPVVDGIEIMSDGTDDIIIGRHECAKSLVRMIKLWENDNDY